MHEVIGWGAILILAGYFLITTKRLASDSRVYQLMNLFGAIGILVNVYIQRAIPVIVFELIWALIALYSLVRSYKRR